MFDVGNEEKTVLSHRKRDLGAAHVLLAVRNKGNPLKGECRCVSIGSVTTEAGGNGIG